MKTRKLNKKQQIIKKFELRNEQIGFLDKKGQKKMNENDMLRIFGKIVPPQPQTPTKIDIPKKIDIIKEQSKFSLSRIIPKRIFFYWGGSDLSWMRYMTLYSFRKMNPDWEVILYVSDNNIKTKGWKSLENQDYYTYKGENYYNKLKELNIKIENVEFPDIIKNKLKNISPIHMGDLFRYYQLYLNGGFYCDMDVLFFRPMNNFYEKIIKGGYDTIVHEYKSIYGYSQTIGFLGASINNEYYKNLFEFGINSYNSHNYDKIENDYQSMGIKLIYNMFIGNKNTCEIYDIITTKYSNLKFYNLSTTFIYKFDWTQIRHCFTNSIQIKDFEYDSIGYHWYGGGVESQKFNNILTEKNYSDYKTTFSTIVDEIYNMGVDSKGYIIKEEIEKPKISIVMTSYNRAELLNLGLSSIVKQKIDYPLEVVVVNDGADDNTKKVCDSYKNKLNIKYIFSGYRNSKGMIYRSSPIPINIGIKNSSGDIIILSCAEIYHLNNGINEIIKPLIKNHNYLTIPESMYFDNSSNYTSDLLKNKISNNINTCELRKDHVEMPFLMGVWKDKIFDIGGYDEDLIGYASEDNDFVDRLKLNECEYYRVDAKIIHLYHGKRCSGLDDFNNPDWVYNHKIYEERKGVMIRNKNKEWGLNIRISIITTYYNRKTQFYKTLKSIERSMFKDFELIVVDDCSSDEERLEDLLSEFPFMKIIRMEKQDKWYVSSSPLFNIGIKAAIGDIIILQNPECLHVHDILTYINNNIDETRHISISTYSLNEELTSKLFIECENNKLLNFFNTLPQQSTDGGKRIGWLNHSKYEPTYYHYCSAITKKNMEKLNGFDERYAFGVAKDDDEFVIRVGRLGLNKIIADEVSVIHQHHKNVYYSLPNWKELYKKNELLLNNITKKETTFKVN